MVKVSDLSSDPAPTSDDLLYLVNAPGTTPGSRKTTVGALAASASFSSLYAAASTVTGHIGAVSAAHAASAISFSPTGTLSSTNAQAAIAEAASEAASDLAAHAADATAHGNLQTVVRWDGAAWEARPASADFGVLFLSTNDPAATAPDDANLMVGDLWDRHPDAV